MLGYLVQFTGLTYAYKELCNNEALSSFEHSVRTHTNNKLKNKTWRYPVGFEHCYY